MYVNIEKLSFKYKNAEIETLKNFNLHIEKGDIVCILGESGSGKSTVLRIISGLEEPSSGNIIINNEVIVNENTFVLPEKRGVGMIFQDYALFPHMTVEENIKFGLKKLSKSEKDERVEKMLNLVNLNEYGKRYPHELSGGQQQRVAIARAVAPNPSLLLLDEPFSNLDAHLQNKIREELKSIIKKAEITSIFVTHNVEDAKAVADKVIILKDGQIEKQGRASEILK